MVDRDSARTGAAAMLGSIDRFLDEIERGDVEAAIEAVAPLIHPEMEFTSLIGSEVDGRTYIGADGLREWFQDYVKTFDTRYENRRITALSDDVVLGLFTNRMRGRGSEVEIASDIGTVWELEDGVVVRARTFPSEEEATKAAEAARA